MIKANEFWHETEVAVNYGLVVDWFDLPVVTRAWLMAHYDAKRILEQAMDKARSIAEE